jgi:hypothetical protein
MGVDNPGTLKNDRWNTRHLHSGNNKKQIQYTSESRTRFGFRIRSYASPDHSIARPFKTRTLCPRNSLDRFIKKRHIKYFIHAKTV